MLIDSTINFDSKQYQIPYFLKRRLERVYNNRPNNQFVQLVENRSITFIGINVNSFT